MLNAPVLDLNLMTFNYSQAIELFFFEFSPLVQHFMRKLLGLIRHALRHDQQEREQQFGV